MEHIKLKYGFYVQRICARMNVDKIYCLEQFIRIMVWFVDKIQFIAQVKFARRVLSQFENIIPTNYTYLIIVLIFRITLYNFLELLVLIRHQSTIKE